MPVQRAMQQKTNKRTSLYSLFEHSSSGSTSALGPHGNLSGVGIMLRRAITASAPLCSTDLPMHDTAGAGTPRGRNLDAERSPSVARCTLYTTGAHVAHGVPSIVAQTLSRVSFTLTGSVGSGVGRPRMPPQTRGASGCVHRFPVFPVNAHGQTWVSQVPGSSSSRLP